MEQDLYEEYSPFDKYQEQIDIGEESNDEFSQFQHIEGLYKQVELKMNQEEEEVRGKVRKLVKDGKDTLAEMGFFDEFLQINNIMTNHTKLYLTKKRMEFKVDALKRKLFYRECGQNPGGTVM